MAWYLNKALTTLRDEVNARWPNRDKASDGTIGDEAHQGTSSDHNQDADGSVDAWDMDDDGVDAELVKAQFEKHKAAQYWIHNRVIANRSYGVDSTGRWNRRNYTGANPHDKHVHFNTRESHEDSAKGWGIWPILTEELDMSATEVHDAVWDPEAKEYYDDDGNGIRDLSSYGDALFKGAARGAESRDIGKRMEPKVSQTATDVAQLKADMSQVKNALATILERLPEPPPAQP